MPKASRETTIALVGLALALLVLTPMISTNAQTTTAAPNSSNSSNTTLNVDYQCNQHENSTNAKADCNGATVDEERVCIYKEDLAGNTCVAYDKCAEEGSDADKCGGLDGCAWDQVGGVCEAENGNEAEEGECESFDQVKDDCSKLKNQAKCEGYDDSSGKCAWDKECDKNRDYDPNNCPDLEGKEDCDARSEVDGNLTLAPGCSWEDNVSPAVCKMTTGQTDESSCDETDNQKDCNRQDEDGNQACKWKVAVDEVEDPDQECFEATEKSICNVLINDDDNRRCNWAKDEFSNEEKCQDYDHCSAITKQNPCERDNACEWNSNNECEAAASDDDGNDVGGGGGGGGGEGGAGTTENCGTQTTKDTCTEFEDDSVDDGGDDGGDDGAAPTCMWTKKTTTSCINFDACRRNKAFNKEGNSALCDRQAACSWTSEGNVEFCTLTEAAGDVGCNANELGNETACNAHDGGATCMWFETVAKACKNYEACAYADEDECEAATEGCYFKKQEEKCYEGKRPVTETTTTQSTTTLSTTTTTTIFSCKKNEWQCSDGECIRTNYQCDGGAPDCNDGSDEKTGPGFCSTSTTTQTPFGCPSEGRGYFMCASMDECVLDIAYCDDEFDCADESDEDGCATKTETSTTGTATSVTSSTMTSTTTRTSTTSTTTLDACITSKACNSVFAFEDARNQFPLAATTGQCRACVLGQTLEEVCATLMTNGCPEIPTLPPVDTRAKSKAEITDFMRVKFPDSIDLADIPTNNAVRDAVLVALTSAGGNTSYAGVRPSDVIDIEYTDVAGSDYMLVSLFTKKFAAAKAIWSTKGALTKNGNVFLTIQTGDSTVEVQMWNGETYDVDAPDKRGNPSFIVVTTPAATTEEENVVVDEVPGLEYDENGELILEEYGAGDVNYVNPYANGTTKKPTTRTGSSSDDEGGGGGTIAAIIVVILLLGAAGGVFFWHKKRKAGGGPRRSAPGKSVPTYENQAYDGGTPDWADPDYPFLSRQEAEAQVRSNGGADGSFVVRQAAQVERGYVITAISGGSFVNVSLKRQGPNLMYGPKKLGQSISEAITVLSTGVKVQIKGGAPFFLRAPGAAPAAAAKPKKAKKAKPAAAPVQQLAPVAAPVAAAPQPGGYLQVQAGGDDDEYDPDASDSDDDWDLDADA